MPTFNFAAYEENDTVLLTETNFGHLDPGMTSPILRVHIWNDKDNAMGADSAPTPRVYMDNGPDDISPVFAGTTLNGFKSMLEARSCRAFGTPADLNTLWTPIGPSDMLVVGDMPPNSMREIEVRWKIPIDAGSLTPEKTWQFKVSA